MSCGPNGVLSRRSRERPDYARTESAFQGRSSITLRAPTLTSGSPMRARLRRPSAGKAQPLHDVPPRDSACDDYSPAGLTLVFHAGFKWAARCGRPGTSIPNPFLLQARGRGTWCLDRLPVNHAGRDGTSEGPRRARIEIPPNARGVHWADSERTTVPPRGGPVREANRVCVKKTLGPPTAPRVRLPALKEQPVSAPTLHAAPVDHLGLWPGFVNTPPSAFVANLNHGLATGAFFGGPPSQLEGT